LGFLGASDFGLTSTLTDSFADAFLTAIGPPSSFGATIRVLDVGVGTARIPIEICRRRAGFEFTGIDCGPTILRRARQEIDLAGLTGAIRVREADACALPHADGSFDAVISNSLVHHLPRRRDVLSEMIRVLRPGGLLFVRDSLPQADASIIARTLLHIAVHRGRPIDRAGLPNPLSLDDARQLAAEAGIPRGWVRRCGLRHWLLSGRLVIGAGALHAGSRSRTV
jgi:SAM-dependent methyltransferase